LIYYDYFSKNSCTIANSSWPITCPMCDVALVVADAG